MGCDGIFAYTPFFWAACSGLCIGYAIVRIVKKTGTQSRKTRAKAIKWTKVSLAMTISVICALAGVFIPGPEKILDIRLVYMLTGAIVISAPAFVFPRIGLPILVLIVVAFITTDTFALMTWQPIETNSELGRFTLLNEDGKYEVDLHGSDAQFVTIPDKPISLKIYRVSLSPYYFYLCPGGYAGLGEFAAADNQSGGAGGFVEPTPLIRFFSKLPGRSMGTVVSEPIDPRLLYDYKIKLVNDGIDIMLKPPGR